ncbi:metallophosphoesterase family protein [Oricola sp.]|uniref:metallophosphoesterase family protein n=1 Tax=Oricola sp. TaxID=1979950 RepID=UPI0025CC8EE4|nr:metallophosphoesterase family protein [Oricola sp.]MCI5076348.1 metallophosphatase family protein [Oricola sp.]
MTEFDARKFAVIADIHGNSDALIAVLSDIDAQGIASIVNLGDHLSGPLAARETIEILMARDMICIRGNHDRWLVETDPEEMGPSDRIAYDELEDRHLEWLRALPPTRLLADDVFLCHGTPASDTTYWFERVAPDGGVLIRPEADIAAEAAGIAASLLLCGHSHLPRRVDLADGRTVLNPGSVGCPGYVDDEPYPHAMQTGTPAACYAIVERRPEGWMTSFRHVPYDTARMAGLARERNRPNWARSVATGWVK